MFAGTLSWHKDEVMQSMYLLHLIMYSHQELIASLKNGWQLKSGGEIWAGEEGLNATSGSAIHRIMDCTLYPRSVLCA